MMEAKERDFIDKHNQLIARVAHLEVNVDELRICVRDAGERLGVVEGLSLVSRFGETDDCERRKLCGRIWVSQL